MHVEVGQNNKFSGFLYGGYCYTTVMKRLEYKLKNTKDSMK